MPTIHGICQPIYHQIDQVHRAYDQFTDTSGTLIELDLEIENLNMIKTQIKDSYSNLQAFLAQEIDDPLQKKVTYPSDVYKTIDFKIRKTSLKKLDFQNIIEVIDRSLNVTTPSILSLDQPNSLINTIVANKKPGFGKAFVSYQHTIQDLQNSIQSIKHLYQSLGQTPLHEEPTQPNQPTPSCLYQPYPVPGWWFQLPDFRWCFAPAPQPMPSH